MGDDRLRSCAPSRAATRSHLPNTVIHNSHNEATVIDVPGGSPSTLEIDAALPNIGTARRFVRGQLAGLVADDVTDDLQLLTSELVTNAIEHGAVAPISITVSFTAERASVTVASRGPSPTVGPADTWHVADVEEITGRGLGIVRALADDIDMSKTQHQLTITVHRSLSGSTGAVDSLGLDL